jgi:hypothetical protein
MPRGLAKAKDDRHRYRGKNPGERELLHRSETQGVGPVRLVDLEEDEVSPEAPEIPQRKRGGDGQSNRDRLRRQP